MAKFTIAFDSEENDEDIICYTNNIYCVKFWNCQTVIGHEETLIGHLLPEASSHIIVLCILNSSKRIDTISFLKVILRDDFASLFDNYQHADEILQNHNNYPEKIGNLIVNNLISLLPHYFTFYGA